MAAKNIKDQRFGRLVVQRMAYVRKGKVYWECVCACGAQKNICGTNLRNGSVASCGCLARETKHGGARRGKKIPEYLVWVSMRQRCNNPNNKHFKYYGARGISVCKRWSDFSLFIEDMGPRPSPRHTIERIKNNTGYSPKNCRWATFKEQASNSRRNIIVKVSGERMTLMQAVEKFGGRYGTVLGRVHAGMTIEKALGLI